MMKAQWWNAGRTSLRPWVRIPVKVGSHCECELLALFLDQQRARDSLGGGALILMHLWWSMLSQMDGSNPAELP